MWTLSYFIRNINLLLSRIEYRKKRINQWMNNLFEWNKKMKENKILFNLYKLFQKLLIHFISTQNEVIFKVKIIQYLEFSHFISISNIYIYTYVQVSMFLHYAWMNIKLFV